MQQDWLEDLLAVLDAGSLTAAAEQRFLTQSAFTRRMRAMESAMGTQLLDRTRKPAQLLPHIIEQEAEMRSLITRLNSLRSALSNPQASLGDRVSLACQHTIATTISPRLIRQLTREGDINVSVKATTRDDCLMQLLTSDVDLAIVFDTAAEASSRGQAGLLEEVLGEDKMVPVVAAEFKAPLLESLDEGLLRIVSYPKSIYFGSMLESHFLSSLAYDCQIVRTAETGLALAALHYILEGIGIGWLPMSIAGDDIDKGKLIDLSDRLPSQELLITIVRLRASISPLAEVVWQKIVAELQAE
ncbi:MAG: LysR family transcriptional regulator [Granulosicoccaceae bacterium]